LDLFLSIPVLVMEAASFLVFFRQKDIGDSTLKHTNQLIYLSN